LLILFFKFCEIGLKSLCEFATGQHDAPSTTFTFEADIRAEARDSPFVGAAWMLFAQTQMIVEFEVRKHGFTQTSDVSKTSEVL